MPVLVKIAKPVLEWVWNNVDQESLPAKERQLLLSWMNGEQEPTYEQIEKVSDITHIPFGYFFLQTPPEEELPFPEFCSWGSQNQKKHRRDLINTVYAMEQIQEWTRNYLISEEYDPPAFIGSLTETMDVVAAADAVRQILEIEKLWYKDYSNAKDSFLYLKEQISSSGVLVMTNGFAGSNANANANQLPDFCDFRVFAVMDSHAPLICLNTNDSQNGQLFSVLHAFICICLGKSAIFCGRNDTFSDACSLRGLHFCNAVTAELLVPMTDFILRWKECSAVSGMDTIIDNLAKEYHCEAKVIADRALEAGYISPEMYEKVVYNALNEDIDHKRKYKRKDKHETEKDRKHDGVDDYHTLVNCMDRRFLAMLSSSVASGQTSYSEAFRLTNTNRQSFDALTKSMDCSFTMLHALPCTGKIT